MAEGSRGQRAAEQRARVPDEVDLVEVSVAAMLKGQHESGAFVASPDFGQYQYCWLRDGSFVAYALDRAGEHRAAARFHHWAASAISGIAERIEAAVSTVATVGAGGGIDPSRMPPARFALDGTLAVDDDWPNFQIDGYGTWIWSLAEHERSSDDDLAGELSAAVDLAGRYVAALALHPCYDVWEEAGDHLHSATLASAYAGLVAADGLLGSPAFSRRGDEVRGRLLELGADGVLAKSDAGHAVDSSSLWVGIPFGALEPASALMRATAAAIEDQLCFEGGLRRYLADTYYGGGAWPVLTASLGWHNARTGDPEGAQRCLAWVRSRFGEDHRLPEQVGGERRDPVHHREWVDRWGPPAADLLWSHAMHVVLALELGERSAGAAGGDQDALSLGTRHEPRALH